MTLTGRTGTSTEMHRIGRNHCHCLVSGRTGFIFGPSAC